MKPFSGHVSRSWTSAFCTDCYFLLFLQFYKLKFNNIISHFPLAPPPLPIYFPFSSLSDSKPPSLQLWLQCSLLRLRVSAYDFMADHSGLDSLLEPKCRRPMTVWCSLPTDTSVTDLLYLRLRDHNRKEKGSPWVSVNREQRTENVQWGCVSWKCPRISTYEVSSKWLPKKNLKEEDITRYTLFLDSGCNVILPQTPTAVTFLP